jgi:1-acyl-sn-glycerol-3-phosphate acyltransferase
MRRPLGGMAIRRGVSSVAVRRPPMSLYRLLGYIFVKPTLTLLLRPQVKGRRRIPRRGGCIVVANHESPIDPFVLGLACHRTIRWIAKAELFDSRVVRLLLRVVGTIPVERGEADRKALAAARDLVRRGALLGLFPQGTCLPYRHRPFKRGAARLALELGVPIVPVALVNTEKVLPPNRFKPRLARVRILIGEPIRVDPVESGQKLRDAATRLTEELEQAIADLRRPYGEPAHAWIG